MQILFRILKQIVLLALFLLLLAFAIKNDGLVRVQVFFDAAWDVPLVVVMLASLVLGVLIAGIALASTIVGLRRELAAARRKSAAQLPSSLVSPTRLRGPFTDISDSF